MTLSSLTWLLVHGDPKMALNQVGNLTLFQAFHAQVPQAIQAWAGQSQPFEIRIKAVSRDSRTNWNYPKSSEPVGFTK